MIDIITALVFYVLSLFFVLGLWRVTASVGNRSEKALPPWAVGQRSAHSNLTLVTIGIFGFYCFPLILVGVKWSEGGAKISSNGYLHVFAFLLIGAVSYIYFIRTFRGNQK
jgi:hypothetical protein